MSNDEARKRRVQVSSLVAQCVPLLFLIPVAAALVVSAVRLVATGHPVYGWSMSINADAEAMYLGIWPFQDPAHGFTGDAYTPLFPAVTSALDHLHLWTGWPVLLTIASTVGIAAIVAWIAYRPDGRRAPALVEAAGVGALAVSFVFGLLRNSVYEARPDQFTWLLAFAGLALLPRAARGGPGRRAVVVMILAAAFWAKQTAIIASLAAVVVVAALVWARRIGLRGGLTWVVSLVLSVLVVRVALDALTDGWQSRFNFGIHLPASRTVWDVLPDLLERSVPALAVLLVLSIALWRSSGIEAPRVWIEGASDRGLVGVAFAVMAVLGFGVGVYLRRYVGGDDNSLLPCIWAIGGLVALAYRSAARDERARGPAAAALVLAFASTFVPGHGAWRLRGGDVIPDQHWSDLPSRVAAYARTHLVWDPILSDLNVESLRTIEPNYYHLREALQRDARPKQFERALLGRRFDAVMAFPPRDASDHDASRYGIPYEDNYMWKLGYVITLKYRRDVRVPRLPSGADYGGPTTTPLVPRPGPDPAPWIDHCFGPFTVAGAQVQIRRGGGLWCMPEAGVLQLRETPAEESEVVTTHSVRSLGGSLAVRSARAAGEWWVTRDGAWTLRATTPRSADRLDVMLSDADGKVAGHEVVDRAALHAAGGLVRVTFVTGGGLRLARDDGPNALRAAVPAPRDAGKLHVWASRSTHAEFNFGGLRVE